MPNPYTSNRNFQSQRTAQEKIIAFSDELSAGYNSPTNVFMREENPKLLNYLKKSSIGSVDRSEKNSI